MDHDLKRYMKLEVLEVFTLLNLSPASKNPRPNPRQNLGLGLGRNSDPLKFKLKSPALVDGHPPRFVAFFPANLYRSQPPYRLSALIKLVHDEILQ